MFRSFIYLDQDALARYSVHLGMSTGFRVKSVDGSVSASMGAVNANVSVAAERSYSDSDPIRAFDEFEAKLAEHESNDYFDFLEHEGYDAATLPHMCLVRFAGLATVPEGFDLFEAIQRFMPLMGETGLINLKQNDASTRLAMEMLSEKQGAIPIVVDGLEVPIASKLKTEWIEGGDSIALEEIQDDEAIFLCRVVAHAQGERVAVFDPLKDFMRVNRAMRRTMKRSEGLEIVYEDGPVIKAEVVAIYH